jgi:amino acid efflux transporter
MLFVYYVFDVDLRTALLIPSGAAVLVYVIGSAAGVKLLRSRGVARALPWISLFISVAVLPFVGPLALVALLAGAAALAYSAIFTRLRARRDSSGSGTRV